MLAGATVAVMPTVATGIGVLGLMVAFTALTALLLGILLAGTLLGMNARFRADHAFGLLSGKRLAAWIDARLQDLAGQHSPVTI